MKKQLLKQSIKSILLLSLTSIAFNSIAAEPPKIIATVNGSNITNDVFELYGEKRIGAPPSGALPEEKRKELIDELVSRELIYQDAVNEGLDKNEYVLLQIQEQIYNLLTRIKINNLIEENPPSDTLKQSIYQTQIVDPASSEYKASHILSDNVDVANEIILSLNKGGDFTALAKEKSIGPSAVDGGDLGWFSPNQMVRPFSDAVEKLKPGEYTKRPIKTRFGWHVIKLEESRKVDPPSFASVEEQVLKVAQNQIISDYLKKLRDAATIEIK